ncbi:MAG TPA: ATP-binding cassette domain-containing protein [Cellulomonas sp.]
MTGIELRDVRVRLGSTDIVQGVSLTIPAGGSVGLVGESGSGKTTLARAVVGEVPVSGGAVLRDGAPLTRPTRAQRRDVQLVSQDPYSSLNPRMTVAQTLGELLRVHRIVPRAQVRRRSAELLALVSLEPAALDAYPGQFSGGQRQRIAIARALAVEPSVLVADEPTSALDVSVQATVIALLHRLREELGLTLLFISHDLGVVNALCDTVAVMQAGRLVEVAPREDLFRRPRHPYTRALLEAVPRIEAAVPTLGEPA